MLSPSVRPFLHTQDMYFVFVQLLSSGSAWFAIIIIIITCLFPDVIKKVFYRHLHPTSTQKSQVSVTLQTQIQMWRERCQRLCFSKWTLMKQRSMWLTSPHELSPAASTRLHLNSLRHTALQILQILCVCLDSGRAVLLVWLNYENR